MTQSYFCLKCQENKSFEEFPPNKKLKRGVDSWCVVCHRAAHKRSYHENIQRCRADNNLRRKARINWLQSLKTFPCADCGLRYEPYCMDFDHTGDKIKSVTRMTLENTPKEKILEEISRCDLVCVLCHNDRTKRRIDEKLGQNRKYNHRSLRNIEIINLAKEQPCVYCNQIHGSHNMQLDHKDPSLKFKNISQLKNFKVDTLLDELGKCQVVCALCHRRKSVREQQAGKYLSKI